ncbi:MAG: SRPBCC family protein [Gemmatimonadota bacterium]
MTPFAPRVYRLRRSQRLAIGLDQAWGFFSDPRNLQEITPENLRFAIVSEVPERIYPGLMIEYRLMVPPGVPMGWLTEIKAVEAPRRFVDEQRFGPYALWLHEHRFGAVEGGVECEDLVHYALPYGGLGRLAHALFVRRQLEGIFAYRARVLRQRFGEPEPAPAA